tara:strand:+ start:2996 stop:3250 length:255 start_codon:yes stop_codon:yes gene_type:complete
MISQQIVIALRRKYEAEIDCARANVQVYLNHPVGVAEHPNIVESVNSQIEIIASARDKLQEIEDMEMAQIHRNIEATAAEVVNG